MKSFADGRTLEVVESTTCVLDALFCSLLGPGVTDAGVVNLIHSFAHSFIYSSA